MRRVMIKEYKNPWKAYKYHGRNLEKGENAESIVWMCCAIEYLSTLCDFSMGEGINIAYVLWPHPFSYEME